jgi:hypothetical protein
VLIEKITIPQGRQIAALFQRAGILGSIEFMARPRFAVFLSLACGACAVFCVSRALAAEDDVAAWVAKLGDDNYDTRMEAREKLAKMGEAARVALKDALKASADDEVKTAAKSILALMNKASVTFLALDRDGNPVSEARAEVSVTSVDSQASSHVNKPPEQKPFIIKQGVGQLADLPPGPV